MNRSISLAAVCVAMLFSGAASAQTKYFSRVGLPKAADPASSSTPPAGSKKLVCSGLTMGKNAYPEVGSMPVQGPIRTTTTVAEAFKSCNDLGATSGEAYKDYNNCRVYKAAENTYYSYFVRASGVLDYGNDPNAMQMIGNAPCTYYP
jgi:hypothetical protein